MTINPSQHDHTALGRHGEELATEALAGAGYQILEHNWLASTGEVDVIAGNSWPSKLKHGWARALATHCSQLAPHSCAASNEVCWIISELCIRNMRIHRCVLTSWESWSITTGRSPLSYCRMWFKWTPLKKLLFYSTSVRQPGSGELTVWP